MVQSCGMSHCLYMKCYIIAFFVCSQISRETFRMTLSRSPLSLALLAALTQSIPAQAQQVAHDDVAALPGITVSASPLARSAEESIIPVTIVEGDALIQRRRGTLGELLDGQPGVHADTFGGGASRPVIRGQTAPRVKVLSDGSEIMDASAVSPDHVVTVDTLLAERIEILRGPSALLYGGGAIGGVVNVLDNKIPTAMPERGIEGSLELQGATAARERAGAFAVTGGTGRVVFHAEGARSKSDDYRVGHWDEKRVKDSNADTTTGSLGMTFLGDNGYLGAAYSYREEDYGLPGHSHEYEDCHPHGQHLHCGGHDHGHGHDHDHDHDHGGGHSATAHLLSERFDIRGEWRDPMAGVEKIRLRAGYTDYRHDERDGDEKTTVFTNRGHDTRLELQHRPLYGWRGVLGVQTARSEFESSGLENFMPRTRTTNTGIFLVEEYPLGDWRFELGARHEWQRVTPDNSQPASDLRAVSWSAAAVWDFAPAYAATLSFTQSQRLPNAQELYARGVHLATNTYELGDANLGKETTRGVDLGLRKHEGDLQFGINVFHSRTKNYIYANTLDQHEDFRLIKYTQHDAEFTGAEANVSYRFSPLLKTTLFGDYVRGKLREGAGNLPRIPAARMGLRADTSWQQWRAYAEYYRVFSQNRIADFESETPGYNMVNAGVAYLGRSGATDWQVYLRGTNLLNRLAYNHASFISRAAPVQGRSLIAGVRFDF